ncbi:conserved membrane protein of unknown function [Petrocella atlantisensis]|uniref:DUF308 domain-containing protein n=1 Tax=Petrocella atlantisensis TaxID=2173034 RepID=A0A3P7PSN8_9FIRM|nr:hypothetical protein [Petrocella atlantisensis]VDN47087.1 conserved membrane protein of unknown function [Petrocella atlantisensis]
MNNGYKYIFSGFLLVLIDINIGRFDLLPDVLGYYLVFVGLGYLYAKIELRVFRIARFLSVSMICVSILDVVTGMLGWIQMGDFFNYAVMIFGWLSELLLVVYIYQGMMAHMTMLEETTLSHQFGSELKRYAVIQGLCLLVMSFSLNMPKEGGGVYLFALMAISIIMHIRLLMNLSAVKKLFEIEEI